jgi:RNA polymerase-binding transcription factor DksA
MKKIKAQEEIQETNKNVEESQNEIASEKPEQEVKRSIQPSSYVESTYGNTTEIDYDDVRDDADIASALEMGFIAKALAEHKSKVAPETHPDFDGETCIDCGADIPEARLKLYKIRCVDCQHSLEVKSKLYGRK